MTTKPRQPQTFKPQTFTLPTSGAKNEPSKDTRPQETAPEFIPVRTVATRLGLSVRRVYALIQKGTIPAVRTGTRAIRIPASAFEEWLDAQNAAARVSASPALPAAKAFLNLLQGESGACLRELLARAETEEDGAAKGFALYLKNHAPRY